MDVIYVKQALILKEAKQIYKNLLATDEDLMKSLCMIDIIQRLGIEHHFAEEIKETLEEQHKILSSDPIDFVNSHELSEVALTFRLLRQGGHYVKPDLFDSLMCNKRNFREKFGEDVKSLIAMYEASQLSIEGEYDLDDIGHLSSELLHAWLSSHQNHSDAIYVANTLQYPLHYGLPRLMDKTTFLSGLKDINEWACLEELAKINSSIVRFMNHNEIIEVSKWWKDLGMAKEPKFAQYQPLKWYMWPMAGFTDPSFSEQRIELTKIISLIYVIDDIFDVHGTLDQLTLFTDLATRWKLADTEELPDFMKICVSFMYKITNDFAEKVYKKHGLNPIDMLKKSWIRYLNSVLKEAHWLNSGHLPKSDEYLNNGVVSPGVHVVLIHAFFLFGHIHDITKETIATLDDNFPNIMYSAAKILRLSDDLEGAKELDIDSFLIHQHPSASTENGFHNSLALMTTPPAKLVAYQPKAAELPVILPDELITEILSFSYVKSLMKMRCVCKSWKSTISDPKFVKLHLKRSALKPHLILSRLDVDIHVVPFPVRRLIENPLIDFSKDPYYRLKEKDCNYVIGSCNGWLCLIGFVFSLDYPSQESLLSRKVWFRFWNPATGKISQKLGLFWDHGMDLHTNYKFAFGYDNSSDTYKVVMLILDKTKNRTHVRVLSLGDNVWRTVESFPAVPLPYRYAANPGGIDGVYLNGSLIWLAIHKSFRSVCIYGGRNINVKEFVIVSFDLGTESYTQLMPPRGFDEMPHVEPTLCILKGCLCFSHDFRRTELIIWQMKTFGVEESWTQLLKISYQNLRNLYHHDFVNSKFSQWLPLHLSDHSDTLILAKYPEQQAILCNLRDNTAVRTRIINEIQWLSAKVYVESLVSDILKAEQS